MTMPESTPELPALLGGTPELPALLGGTPVRESGPPGWPRDWPEVRAAAELALSDGSWGRYHGPHCERLERRLRDDHACSDVLLCASGTAAVELALRGARVEAGDEVIMAAYDFKANFQNILAVGATPVLIDVDPHTWQLDPEQLERAVSDRTKAVIASHLHGGFVAMDPVMEFAAHHGLTVIEDACQCPGAELQGRRAGTIGDVGVFSFGGSKLLTAGRGGAVLTRRPEIAQRIRLYTQRGNEAYPLSEVQAALLHPQLAWLNDYNNRRFEAVKFLSAEFARNGLKPLASMGSESVPGFYKLGLQYDTGHFGGVSRDTFSAAVRAEGIALDAGFRGLHCIHSKRRFRAVGDLPIATQADAEALVLHHPVLLEDRSALVELLSAVRKIKASSDAILQIGWSGQTTHLDT